MNQARARIGIRLAAVAVLGAGCLGLRLASRPAPSRLSAPPAPTRLAGVWTGTVLPNDPRTLALLETDDVTLVEYRLAKEPPVWLVRVGGFGTRAAFHPPEICYVGSDFEVLERGPRTVFVNGEPRTVMRLVLAQGGHRREAWYWFTAGTRATPHYWLQQAWLVTNALRRRPMTGTLVHVSSPMEHPETTGRRLLAFVNALDQEDPPRQIASTHAATTDVF
jgi:EpsI family protein